MNDKSYRAVYWNQKCGFGQPLEQVLPVGTKREAIAEAQRTLRCFNIMSTVAVFEGRKRIAFLRGAARAGRRKNG